jgi:xanthine dehydrogenase YagS FAD-binding subunit
MKSFDYARATTEAALGQALLQGYTIKAGGIDLLDLLKERTAEPEKLVSIRSLIASNPEWTAIKVDGGAAHIGAAATLAQIAGSRELRAHAPVIVQCIEKAATPQLRAVATAAGNLCQRPRCWYFRSQEYNCLKKGGSTCFAVEGENKYHAVIGGGPCWIVHPSNLATGLLATGGTVRARSMATASMSSTSPLTRRTSQQSSVDFPKRLIPADEFFTSFAPGLSTENTLREGEYITDIEVPACAKSAYVDFKEKEAFDWPLAAAGVAWHGDHWRVVLGGVAPVPWRALKAEQVLGANEDVDVELATQAGNAAIMGSRPMTQNGWRLQLVVVAVRDALLKACGKEIPA